MKIDGGTAHVVTLSAGSGSFTINTLTLGAHTLSIDYTSSNGYAASSGTGSLTAAYATTTTPSGSPNPSPSGSAVTLNATVTSTTGRQPAPSISTTPIRSTTTGRRLLSGGHASVSVPGGFTAATNIEAAYTPDTITYQYSYGDYTQTIGAAAFSLTSTPSATTQVGQSDPQTNTASNGTTPYTYSIFAGSVPAGTSISSSTGTVSGTPTAAGAFSYTVKAADNASHTATQVVSGTISKGSQTISFTQPSDTSLTSGPSRSALPRARRSASASPLRRPRCAPSPETR